jgi:2-iminobutanoate/2-iminopropanoate deaminase
MEEPLTVKHKPVTRSDLPKPIGPYSPAVNYENLIFVSGQGATVPETGALAGHDVETQTEQVFKNLSAILEAAGSSLQHVIRCGVFIVDMRDFTKMNAVYERMMDGNKPSRTTVQVAALPIPGLRVEIDAVAYVP